MTIPMRYTIPLEDVNLIVSNIEAYERMINFYNHWLEENGDYEYVEERIQSLTSIMCEYMMAREFALEGARSFGDDPDLYFKVRGEFEKMFPNQKFPNLRGGA